MRIAAGHATAVVGLVAQREREQGKGGAHEGGARACPLEQEEERAKRRALEAERALERSAGETNDRRNGINRPTLFEREREADERRQAEEAARERDVRRPSLLTLASSVRRPSLLTLASSVRRPSLLEAATAAAAGA
eukprot:gene54562-54433_t